MTPKESKQHDISEAVKYLSVDDRKKLLQFIFLLPSQWSALINEAVKKLTLEQCQKVLEFIATMPKEAE